MKNQFVSFINSLFVFVYSLISNPQRVRLIVTAIAVCVVLAALLVPTLGILADGIGTGH